ncbi:PH domain-containing protein [Erythrobacter insulae]|uniref:PH domain-containing protein n=2 Tax=Erythrobacter insulae TaxID=2584124 RepID=A0A547PF88_9SPHN|nr:PH domain-containing protein [Erythrobacter insulae]
MGTPAPDEKVLWKGKPDLAVLARSAFHTRKVALYFAALIGISLTFGNMNAAIVCAVLGVAGLVVLQSLAWLCRRTTVYILTNDRLIIRKGMAIETRINLPLKQIAAANLKMRGKSHGDIAMELNGERLLGYILMWPHVRPFKFAHPQPMLRAVPDAEQVASLLADAASKFTQIERNAAETTDQTIQTAKQENGPAPRPAAQNDLRDLSDRGLEGAPA